MTFDNYKGLENFIKIGILVCFLSFPLFSSQNSLPYIAVSDLVGQGINQNEANIITEQFRAELQKTGEFRLIERSQMQEILKEQGFQQTGCTSDKCAVEVGQLLGVNTIIVGSIGIVGSYTSLTTRILDVRTGEVIITESIQLLGGIDKVIENGITNIVGRLAVNFSKAIIEAARNGNLIELEKLFQKGANANVRDSSGCTALHYATDTSKLGIAKYLIGKGADVNAKDKGGHSPLFGAVISHNEELINLLIIKGADVNALDTLGMSPTFVAAGCGNINALSLLISKGSNVNIKAANGMPLLTYAMWPATYYINEEGIQYVVNLLVNNGAIVDATELDGETPLHMAALMGHFSVVHLLVSKGADINAKDTSGFTPLFKAVTMRHEKTINALIEEGADVNAKDNSGFTVLDLAKNYKVLDEKDLKILEMLKKYGAKSGKSLRISKQPFHGRNVNDTR
jgi:ankyrin repeat protein